VEAIINSTDGAGFLPLLADTATGALHGHGTYFARDARYVLTPPYGFIRRVAGKR
jgi:hypothetical protein